MDGWKDGLLGGSPWGVPWGSLRGSLGGTFGDQALVFPKNLNKNLHIKCRFGWNDYINPFSLLFRWLGLRVAYHHLSSVGHGAGSRPAWVSLSPRNSSRPKAASNTGLAPRGLSRKSDGWMDGRMDSLGDPLGGPLGSLRGSLGGTFGGSLGDNYFIG